MRPLALNIAIVLIVASSAGAFEVEKPAGPPKLHPGVPAVGQPLRLSQPLFIEARPDEGAIILTINPKVVDEVRASTGVVLIDSLPLSANRSIALEVERFHVTTRNTQFVLGRADGRNVPLNFDPDSVVLLRGRVVGDFNSTVFIALSEHGSNGYIQSIAGQFGISSRSSDGARLASDEVAIFKALVAGPNPVPFCEVEGDESGRAKGRGGAAPIHSLRQIQLAIETDYQFYQVLGSAPAAANYVVQLYAAASDMFMRNINTRVDLTFVRIWDTPTVPFQSNLSAFRSYWNANMQSVSRDVAQMFSGRGDLPGGVAYLSALCGTFGYSFCGNVVGHFAGVDESSVYNYDLLVSTHELGHNFGTHHTDVYSLDICNQPTTPPQRGTIMSYCSQTVSGGAAVMDMSFHKVTQDKMKEHTYTVPCVVFDCNQNGTADNIDINIGASADQNANGIPDECEDCNGNGVLDPADISAGTSFDLDSNGIPDECQPDCNNNGIPDLMDIQTGVSADLHGNNIPDECEADCDGNGVSDYNQIMANMTLDKNRNVVLDSCEDCDNDGTIDEQELDGAWNIWAASSGQNPIREYHAVTGVLMRTSNGASVGSGWDVDVAPGRRVLVSDNSGNKIMEFDHQGNFVRNLVPAGSAGLATPAGMVLSPAGTLLVAATSLHRVMEFNLTTGAFIRNFVAAGGGGLSQPLALVYGPDNNLYVSSATNQIFRYNGQTGAFISIFVPSSANGSLMSPRGMVFKPDGNLLVTSFGNNSVREYNGSTGAFVKVWSIIGVAFQGPWCIRIAPNGHVHVSANLVTDSHVTKADIHEFNINTGNWVRGYVQGADAGLIAASGFEYLPGDATDCNQNQVPDNCDIASGASADQNGNGIPDECEPPLCPADITGDGTVNVSDLLAVINNWGGGAGNPADINGDGVVNVSDLLAVINAWGPCS